MTPVRPEEHFQGCCCRPACGSSTATPPPIESFSDLNRISTINEWRTCMKERVLCLGFSRFLFCLRSSIKADCRSALVIGDFPTSWIEAYDRAGYATIDPLERHCMHSVLPVIWTDQLYTSSNQRELREKAGSHALINGVTLALHGPQGQFGTFGLSIDGVDEHTAKVVIQANWHELSWLKDTALQSALKFLCVPKPANEVRLTRREKEVLQWSAIGKTSWEISNICNCSEANVDFHFKNIRRKFGVTSRNAAVVQALSMQIIQV
ncbi:helix-turn-helix transcriptional regulator [Pseudomonas gingeri]|uniref:LuxR family transcriptional regulator n=1 Tax=Pseudomonas gingeri TaxID=117681 RepID=A0A7Y7WXH7_9PSED|nr:LuxR family transcriptional regulator [Pseudomonas gingeri]NWB89230.1 LuxR family transcriptional regulator [Pseudomonas gingeri]